MPRHAFFALLLCSLAAPVLAQDDKSLDAALAKCPGAAEFRRAHPVPPPRIAEAAPRLPELRSELLGMQARDQQVRGGGWSQEEVQRMLQVDAEHLPRIQQIVAEHGFPGQELVGRDGAAAAWLLVQHADADPAFQAQVLVLIKALPQGEVSNHEQMLLTDRVLAGQGEPQRYGSQLQATGGRWQPKPLEGTAAEVDERRAAMGEMPLADYICVASQLFPPPAQ